MIGLEHVIGFENAVTGDAVQRNFDKLNALVLDTGGITAAIRFGVGTTTWPGGSDTSNGLTVQHGLGKTPVVVFTQAVNLVAHARPTAVSATSFTGTLKTVDGSTPAAGNVVFLWLAIG